MLSGHREEKREKCKEDLAIENPQLSLQETTSGPNLPGKGSKKDGRGATPGEKKSVLPQVRRKTKGPKQKKKKNTPGLGWTTARERRFQKQPRAA